MDSMFQSNVQFVVESGFVYVPLLFDPAIEKELDALLEGSDTLDGGLKANEAEALLSPGDGLDGRAVLESAGRRYVKALSLRTLLDNYGSVHDSAGDTPPAATVLPPIPSTYPHYDDLGGILVDGKIEAILLEVMPHFIKRNKKIGRMRLNSEKVLDYINSKLSVPPHYQEKAEALLGIPMLRNSLERIEENRIPVIPPSDGPITASALREWVVSALEARGATAERERLAGRLQRREAFLAKYRKHIGLLLLLTEKGALEAEGFGFFRRGGADDYVIYRRTGEFALQDYYGRTYLFPDCRVGVSTLGALNPVVLDIYKHPLLQWYEAGQKICVRRYFVPLLGFSPLNIIRALEEGINALYHGYNSRRGNGYHRLDAFMKQFRAIDFDDYLIPSDHPKLMSGEVEVKNAST